MRSKRPGLSIGQKTRIFQPGRKGVGRLSILTTPSNLILRPRGPRRSTHSKPVKPRQEKLDDESKYEFLESDEELLVPVRRKSATQRKLAEPARGPRKSASRKPAKPQPKKLGDESDDEFLVPDDELLVPLREGAAQKSAKPVKPKKGTAQTPASGAKASTPFLDLGELAADEESPSEFDDESDLELDCISEVDSEDDSEDEVEEDEEDEDPAILRDENSGKPLFCGFKQAPMSSDDIAENLNTHQFNA